MAFLGDYHTHTIFSKRKGTLGKHATGTLEDNVRQASELGLKEIAITDHGFGHKLYCTYRNKIALMHSQVQELEKKYNIRILIGVEANIISSKGDVDINQEDYSALDIVVCGYHPMARATSIKESFKWSFANMFAKIFGYSKKLIERNTQAYINAINNYDIDIISHPNVGAKIDIIKVGQAAVKRGTMLELNGKRLNYTQQEIDELVKMGVMFIAGSDAHGIDRIADFNKPRKAITTFNIPPQNVANLDKLPKFKRYNRKEEI